MTTCRRRDETGTTVVELMVVLILSSLIMTAVLGVFDALTNADRRQETMIERREALDLALARFGRDVRNATNIAVLAATTEYSSRVDLDVLGSDGTTRPVRWEIAGDVLRRSTLHALGGTPTSTVSIVEPIDAGSGFLYYAASGVALGAERPPGDVASCTVRIGLALSVRTGNAAVSAADEAHLRNRIPGEVGC